MTNAASSIVVFKNQAGDYFLLPQATLEQGRVPDERKAEVERLVAETEVCKLMEGDEVEGYQFGGAIRGAIKVALMFPGGPAGSPGGIPGAILDAWDSIPR